MIASAGGETQFVSFVAVAVVVLSCRLLTALVAAVSSFPSSFEQDSYPNPGSQS